MVLGDEVYNETMLNDLNIFLLLHITEQGPFHFSSGYILMMQYSEFAVPAFPSQLVVAIFFLIELRSPFDKLLNTIHTFFHYNLHHFFITKTITGDECIINMFFKTIIFHVEHSGN